MPNFRFGQFMFDLERGTLLNRGSNVPLRPQSYQVLKILLENHGRLVTRSQLQQEVWGDSIVTDGSLTQCLIDIRKAIGDTDKTIIRTVPRRGFLFDAPVEVNADASNRSGSTTGVSTRTEGRKMLFVLSLCTAAVLSLSFYKWWNSTPLVSSIAVLSFENRSEDPTQEYFSDGVSEELLNLLVKVPQLRVTSRSSSFSFKGKDIDARTIARHLDVAHIVEGTVRRMDDRVRVTAQLTEASSGTLLWSQIYERELGDIFAVQNEIAQRIFDALGDKLDIDEEWAPEALVVQSFDAYDYYLRGRSRALLSTRESHAEAQSLYSAAIDLDPNYAPAYAEFALSLSHYFRSYDADPNHLDRAEELSRLAVELAPDYSRAHLARGQVYSSQGLYQEADIKFQTAAKLNPRSAELLYHYAGFTFGRGKYSQTAQLLESALQLDPSHKPSWALLPMVYRRLGRNEEALDAYRESAETIELGLEINPDDVSALIRLAAARLELGEREHALDTAEHVLQLSGDDAVMLYEAACIFSRAGDAERAMALLEASVEAGFSDSAWVAQDSDLDSIRGHPRFAALLQLMEAVTP